MEATEYTKTFTTSIVLGVDVVPRLGLRQLENLRNDLFHVLQQSKTPKWSIISQCLVRSFCCCCRPKKNSNEVPNENEVPIDKRIAREAINMELGEGCRLPIHTMLYPPGNIIHIGKNNPENAE